MEIKKILIVFKTHLDIGFTDFSKTVIKGYLEGFIPDALNTAKVLREKNSDAQFKWTTGSWLINEYLETAPKEKAEELSKAIIAGDISWHGLPFTTHTELMSAELFRFGLDISKRLDERFGVKTIAAKMTDVPGHTKAMIPLLSEAGIELLHIGVNPASAVPEVPEIFRWRADSGEEITVIYNGEYGNCTLLGNTGVALYFAHTDDNLGAQSAEEVEKLFAELRKEYPDAELVAGDLNDAAISLRPVISSLPVVTEEIGDSWIHGAGTDPKKVMQFRALQKIFDKLPDGEDKTILGKGLIMIPEHTWGLDEKTHLHENENYSRSAFAKRRYAPNYRKMEASWNEQRSFIYDAVDKLSPEVKAECENAMVEWCREEADVDPLRQINENSLVTLGDFTLQFGSDGAINFLKYKDKVFADAEHKLFHLFYEQFSYDNYLSFHRDYQRSEVDWAWEDFLKIGMDKYVKEAYHLEPTAKVFADDNKAVVRFTFPAIGFKEMGCPAKADIIYTSDGDRLLVDFAWFNKPENRLPEAIWLEFAPLCTGKKVSKMGTAVDVLNTISMGNRHLCGTDFGVYYNEMTVECVDNALVSPGTPHLLNYTNISPVDSDPIAFNLYNNIWGTNFPMWYGEDARFRFIITIK